jgi:intracellular septation protein
VSEVVKPKRALNPVLKFALELGPLALFFLVYWKFKIFAATGVMMVSVLVTLVVSYWKLKRIPIMPLVTAVIVVIFGALALWTQNDTFIKIKPTLIYALFSLSLFFGLVFKKPMLQIMFDGALHLTEAGWRILTWRWAIFFLGLALLNEVIWRNMSQEHWVTFKTFGFMPLIVIFALAQAPLIARYEAKSGEKPEAF